MTTISLGLQQFNDYHSLMPNIKMDNLYFEPVPMVTTGETTTMFRRRRPGIDVKYTNTNDGSVVGMIRPIGIFNNDLFVVTSTAYNLLKLFRIHSNGHRTLIGNISTENVNINKPLIKMIYTQFGVVVLNNINEVFVYTVDNVLEQIIVPESYVPQDICSVSNYLLIGCTSGRVYYLEPNEWVFTDDNASGDNSGNTDSALNYFTAESLPDGLIGVQQVRGNIYLFGQQSTEIWQLTGDTGSDGSVLPFSKAVGMDLMKGAIDRKAISLLDNTVMWIGQDWILYRVDTVPSRISTFNVEAQIQASSYYNMWNYTIRGHVFLVIQLDNVTLQYDVATQKWTTLSSGGNNVFNYTGWQDLTETLLFDSRTLNIYNFNVNSFADHDAPITATISAIIEAYTPVYFKNLILTSSQSGPVNYECSIRPCSSTTYTSLGTFTTSRGDMTRSSLYMLGSVVGPYSEIQLSITDNEDINIISLDYNIPMMFRFK